jgi:hypothetical protein
MKNLTRLFVTAIVLLSFGAASFAQVSATATATATIITPIAITKTIDMNFGNVASGPTVVGTVILTPASTRTVTGSCTLPAVAGTVTAASFTVTGLGTSTFSITLPVGATTITSGSDNMTVDTWISTPTPTGVLAAGTATILVGATLHAGISQAAGTYVSAIPFSVTVNYN